MKVPLKWLKGYVDIKLAYQELAEKLTMAGMEVKGIQTVGGTWNNVVVGQVTALNPHPNADRLTLATVNLGSQQTTVVCGAPNISLGQKVPFAQVGARLIDGHTGRTELLKPAKIRGIVSEGMVCSEKELGISDNHEGIMVLSSEAPIGVSLNEYLGDVVFDLDITPNRPDCLSIIGIACEIAALTGEKLRLPEIHYEETGEPIDSFISVDITESNLCPRYCASLIMGVKIASSPDWMQQCLKSYGMRPINNVVDVTNYVMLEYGQPLHAFDYHKLKGEEIIVRRAGEGEAIATLDGTERMLSTDTLVIADAEKAVAVAGVMGGLDAEVTDETDTILLESANFNQAAIRRGCAQLQLQSEASIRFDKGLNPDLPLLPLKRATQLLLELTGGRVAKGVMDVYPGKSEPKGILLSTEEVRRLLGLEVTIEEILKVLGSLGFECQHTDSPSEILAVAPYWRSDITCSADLVEEVARIIGYDKIPITRLSSPLPQQESRLSLGAQRSNFKQKLRGILVSCGFQEILTYSLVSLERLQKLSPKFGLKVTPLKVANPMTKEQEYLRTTLRAGVLTALSYNQKFDQAGIRLFEIGKIFLPQYPSVVAVSRSPECSEGEAKQSPQVKKDLPEEKEMLCAVLSGPRWELSWHSGKELLDFFDAKGVIENLLNRLGLKATFEVGDDESLFPGREADIIIAGDKVGIVGDLHPKVAQAFELSDIACLIEVDVEKLLDKAIGLKRYQPILRFPSVSRDIALVVSEGIIYQQVEDVIQSFPLVKEVTLFDLYTGEQIPEGKKSFAIRIIYQSPDCTLTDEEVDKTQQVILDRLHQEMGASLRS
jgi:phenylalanyl-tRNA synthetase, beta subunit, non-spirochete bacterial